MLNEWVIHLGLCPIRNLTGVPCPGCGMTRALLSLVKLDVKSAFEYHPLFWVIPIAFIVLVFKNKIPLFNRLVNNKGLVWSLIGLFLVTYTWRMVQLFPHMIPLNFNENGLLPLIIKTITQ